MPNETDTGRIEYEYVVYEKPKQDSKKQGVENQGVEIQYVEKQGQLNTKESNTKELNTNKEYIVKENAKYIIEYLNELAGTKFKPNSKETLKLIKARFKDGYELDDFYDVIDNKWKDWHGTDYEKYIRPTTLFNDKHFDEYLNQKSVFKGKPKTTYGSKPTFDNTADHISGDGFNPDNLAKDKNGNLINF